MRTTGLLVVFTLFVIFHQTPAVPVASSYRFENENVMEVTEAKDKSDEASDEEKDEDENDKEEEKNEDKDEEKEGKEDEEKKDDEESKDDEEKKDDEEERKDEEVDKDDEEKKDDEENKDDKEEDEQEPDLNEEQNDESSGEESADLGSDHLVLQGSGNGKFKGAVIEDSERGEDKPEKRSADDQKRPSKATQGNNYHCSK